MLRTNAINVHKEICPECGDNHLVLDTGTGELVCSRCGLVLRCGIINRGPEWRGFTLEERELRSRVGSPVVLKMFDKGLSTTFRPSRDVHGRPLSPREQRKMRRLWKWNVRARYLSSTERNLSRAMNELSLMCNRLHIPTIVEEIAALIYRKTRDAGLLPGRPIDVFVAAACYAACRLTRTPRSLVEIAAASARSRKEIARHYRLIQRSLSLKMPIDDPIYHVSQIASKLELSQKTQSLAAELLRQMEKKKATLGKSPVGIAAAALYVAAKRNMEKITQKGLARAAQVTEVTIRNGYKHIGRILGF